MYEPECNDDFIIYDEAEQAQKQINSLHAWRFEGSVGRNMMEFLKAGYCMLGKEPTTDYWGNRIPSRDEVQEGTMGSYQFVAERHGVEWADFVKGL